MLKIFQFRLRESYTGLKMINTKENISKQAYFVSFFSATMQSLIFLRLILCKVGWFVHVFSIHILQCFKGGYTRRMSRYKIKIWIDKSKKFKRKKNYFKRGFNNCTKRSWIVTFLNDKMPTLSNLSLEKKPWRAWNLVRCLLFH